MNGVKTVNIYVPFRQTSTGATYEYQLNNAGNSDPAFNSLKNIGSTASTGLALSAFNFLNELQWGNFYSFPNSRTPTTTDLVSSWVYVVSGFNTTTAEPSSTSGVISPIVYSIADKLCFGSFTQGIVITFFNLVPNTSQIKLPPLGCLVRHLLLLDLSRCWIT